MPQPMVWDILLNIMGKLKRTWSIYKKPILLLLVLSIVLLVITTILPAIRESEAEKSPVVSITAENGESYRQGEKISTEDFTVTAKHENGDTTEVPSEEIEISTETPAKTGNQTEVTVSYKDFDYKLQVKNDRRKVVAFPCGSPNTEDVMAVLYSNGELAFEGSGDILAYLDGEYPWKDYEGMDDNPIVSVSFEKGVAPTSLDDYFSDIETLEYIKNIPVSVESMARTCSGCIALTSTPDITECENLRNLTETYFECEALENASAIPASVRTADRVFYGCVNLQKGAGVSLATGVTSAESMYEGCSTLIDAQIPPNVIEIGSMLAECINLRITPEIPDTVENMVSCFSGDVSLVEASTIPAGVKDVTSCFEGCEKLEGTLVVEANPESYSSFLKDCSVATSLDLDGSSKVLDVLANTADGNRNITVQEQIPNPDANYDELMGQ